MAGRQTKSKNDLKNEENSQEIKMLIAVKLRALALCVYSSIVDGEKLNFRFFSLILGHLKVCSR